MTTAEEARYRINYPNSSPRAVKVVALDQPSEAVVNARGAGLLAAATFFTAPKIEGAPKSGDRSSIEGLALPISLAHEDLIDEIATADLIVMVASAGTNADAASVIAEALQCPQGDDHGANHRQRS